VRSLIAQLEGCAGAAGAAAARSSLLPGSIALDATDIDRNQATRLLIEARRRSLA
jgi:hypothetical protein